VDGLRPAVRASRGSRGKGRSTRPLVRSNCGAEDTGGELSLTTDHVGSLFGAVKAALGFGGGGAGKGSDETKEDL
jgi:hypothetical protein